MIGTDENIKEKVLRWQRKLLKYAEWTTVVSHSEIFFDTIPQLK
jgi:hypothetical protein